MFAGGLTATGGGKKEQVGPVTDLDLTHFEPPVASHLGTARAASAPPISSLLGSSRAAFRRARPVDAPDASARSDRGWLRKYQALLLAIDLVSATAAVVIAYMVRFGPQMIGSASLDTLTAFALPMIWVLTVAANRGYDGRFIGVGTAEFSRVFRSFIHLTAIVALVSFMFKMDLARGFTVLALLLAVVIDTSGRATARLVLRRERTRGAAMRTVLAVGGPESVLSFAANLERDPHAGLRVVAACLPGGSNSEEYDALTSAGVQILGDADSIVDSVRACGADTVAVLSGHISAEKLRWISWQLESTDAQLIVSPGLTEVAGRRLHIQPVAGLPLLHVDVPQFSGFARIVKSSFDRVVAGLALLLLAPVLLVVSLIVRRTSAGPAFFRQERVGRNGSTFRMVKFRSMYIDAEERLAELRELNEHDGGVMFKMRDDPRVTRIGKVLRRTSLDELPQLINVLTGSMSLVGPRPPLPTEVSQYGLDARRRLLVRPGLTGLWQISGRSDLSWEESVRLDLRYVENWSLASDLSILAKTFRAVARSSGAY
jgi:exopolysaccharide biosynthesis polyprenyl glycosylphosphotransferase